MHAHDSRGRRIAVCLAVALVAVATLAPPAAAQSDDEPAFVVSLHPDGSAEVVVRSTFDLTTDAERAAFETLTADDEARANATARFRDRLGSVAADAEDATGREMRVTDASVDLRRTADDETGVVSLSATWTGLAAVEGETLVVTEPFASGFVPDRRFVLRTPDGYAVGSVAPAPDERSDGELAWATGAELEGFAVELTPAPGGGAMTGGQPGFGAVAALVAILVVTAALAKRRYDR